MPTPQRFFQICLPVALLVGGTAGCSPVHWESSAQSGMAKAQKTNRRALIEFVSTFDQGAAQMDQEVFNKTHVQTLMEEFVPIRLNAAWNKELANKYNVQKTPAFVVLRPDASFAGMQEGTMTDEQFRFFLIKHRLK